MFCICTVSFTTLLNGSPAGEFQASRGLRQGDPLSPYLFILCADVLSATIAHHVDTGELQGIRISRAAPIITHVMYADNTILFGTLSITELHMIK